MGPVVVSSSSKTTLDLVGNTDATMLTYDVIDDGEIFGWRGYSSSHSLNRFSDKAGDFTRCLVLNYVFYIVCTFHTTTWILESVRTAIAIAGMRMMSGIGRITFESSGAMCCKPHRD